jgi:hypothetical protein
MYMIDTIIFIAGIMSQRSLLSLVDDDQLPSSLEIFDDLVGTPSQVSGEKILYVDISEMYY